MENHGTHCQTCGDLLAAYKRSVTEFTEFVREMLKADARVATNEAQKLSQQCKNGSDSVTALWRQHHLNLAAKWALHQLARVTGVRRCAPCNAKVVSTCWLFTKIP